MIALPATLKPELATLVARPPAGDDWLYEIKFDGYRLLARIERKAAQLFTRNGNDWTARLRPLEKELRALKLPDGWYDGEIVVLNDEGKPSFNLLQLAFDVSKPRSIIYYLFDVPYCAGEDLRGLPLIERRARLADVLGDGSDAVRFSAALDGDIHDLIGSACELGLEGIIGKRKGSRYVSRRSDDWIKLKCSLRQEFVIGGFTDPEGSRSGFGSLLLGVFDKAGELQYAGNVGTGFDTELLVDLRAKLDSIETTKKPFPASTKIPKKGVHWVEPKMVAEVSFGEWTPSGHIRHSTFRGLRADKPARQIRREKPSSSR